MRASILVLLALVGTATAAEAQQQARATIAASAQIQEVMGAAVVMNASENPGASAGELQLRVNSSVRWQMLVEETAEVRVHPGSVHATPVLTPVPLSSPASLRPATGTVVEIGVARDDDPRAPLPMGVDRVVTITMIAY